MAQDHLQQTKHHCPWCPYTDATLTKVLRHMETRYTLRWRDLALYPPIAGGGPS
jgi:hypothetical protein